MKFNERLQSLRIKSDMTQKELGNAIGVSVVSIGGWENGTRKPSAEAIISLSKVFHVTTDYLLGVIANPEKDTSLLSKGEKTLLNNYRLLDSHGKRAVDALCLIEKSRVESEDNLYKSCNSARYIPRYTTPAAAGSSIPLDGNEFEMVLVDDTTPIDADFAVGIQGNSMYPYISDGDTVYVKRCSELSIGDIGIFCVDGEMYCKQYYLDEEENLILLSVNPRQRHTNVFVKSDSGVNVRCYGKVLLGYRVNLPDYIKNNLP